MKILKSNFAIILIGLFTAMCLIGCAKAPKDADLQPLLNQFLSDGATFGKTFNTDKLTIEFADLVHPIAGECIRYDDGSGVVQIDKTYWEEYGTDEYKQVIMYHELGHCLLLRGHVTNYVSIMNPTVLLDSVFDASKAGLIQELFTGPLPGAVDNELAKAKPFTNWDGPSL